MASDAAYRERERGRKLKFEHFQDTEMVLIYDGHDLSVRLPYSDRTFKLVSPVDPSKLAVNTAILKTAKKLVGMYGDEKGLCDLDTTGDSRHFGVDHRYRMDRMVETGCSRRNHRFSLIHEDYVWSDDGGDTFNLNSCMLLDCDLKGVMHYRTGTSWSGPQLFNPKKDDAEHSMFAAEALNMIGENAESAEKQLRKFLKKD